MKRIIRWIIRILLVLVVLVALAVLLRGQIAKSVIEKQIHAQTGMRARVGLVDIGLDKPSVKIENLRIYNPPGFDDSRFADIPEIYVEYNRAALLSRKLHLKLVRFRMDDLNIVENFDGKSNLKYLQEKQKEAAAKTDKAEKPTLEFAGIETLKLQLGRVRFNSMRNPSRNREIRLDINEELKNVKSAKDFAGLLAQVMLKRGADFVGVGIEAAADTAKSVVESAGDAAEKTGKKLLDALPLPLKKKE